MMILGGSKGLCLLCSILSYLEEKCFFSTVRGVFCYHHYKYGFKCEKYPYFVSSREQMQHSSHFSPIFHHLTAAKLSLPPILRHHNVTMSI